MSVEFTAEELKVIDAALAYYARMPNVSRPKSKSKRAMALGLRHRFNTAVEIKGREENCRVDGCGVLDFIESNWADK